ncbi:energy-coupling factor transporter transmembrane protein EcfT, partial [Staphylococcus hominis]
DLRAEELAIAMEVRGYDINIKRTSYRLLHWQYKDTLTVLLLIPIATILFILKFSGV